MSMREDAARSARDIDRCRNKERLCLALDRSQIAVTRAALTPDSIGCIVRLHGET